MLNISTYWYRFVAEETILGQFLILIWLKLWWLITVNRANLGDLIAFGICLSWNVKRLIWDLVYFRMRFIYLSPEFWKVTKAFSASDRADVSWLSYNCLHKTSSLWASYKIFQGYFLWKICFTLFLIFLRLTVTVASSSAILVS